MSCISVNPNKSMNELVENCHSRQLFSRKRKTMQISQPYNKS